MRPARPRPVTTTRSVAALAGLSLVMGLAYLGPAQADPAPEARRSSVTANVAKNKVPAISKIVVKGKVKPSTRRQVLLQRQRPGGWATIAKTRSRKNGAYTLRERALVLGRDQYRVRVPKAGSKAATSSKPKTIRVVPLGRRSDWSRLVPKDKPRWNPCEPIGWRVNMKNAPKGSLQILKGAVARIENQSGLDFRYRGKSSILPGQTKRPTNYPSDTQTIIAFSTPRKSKFLPKGPLAVGGGYYKFLRRPNGFAAAFTHGYVVANYKLVKKTSDGFGPVKPGAFYRAGTRGSLFMHELGHSVGLGHTKQTKVAKKQMMYPVNLSKYAVFGAGDVTGLNKVGAAQGCIKGARQGYVGPLRNALIEG